MKKVIVLLIVIFMFATFLPAVAAPVATDAKAICSGFEISVFLKDDTAYFFMPATADLSKVTVVSLSAEGTEVSRVENLNLADEAEEKITLDGREYKIAAMKSELPSLIFSINEEYGTIADMNAAKDHDVFCYGDVSMVIDPSVAEEKGWEGFTSVENKEDRPGTVEIRGRGNTTWTYEDAESKRPYQFKLEKKADILGMGKHKTWVLLKNDGDVIRNKLGIDLAIMLGIPNSVQAEFVDVFMNGEYLGNYLLSEKVQIDNSRIDIANIEEEYEKNGNSLEGIDLTGGYLLEIDNWGDGDIRFRHDLSTWVVVKEPDFLAGSATDEEYAYIYNFMTDFLNAVYTDGKMSDGSSYLDHIDVDSFIRYFFHQEFLRNGDTGISSTYFYKDRDSINGKLYAGPVWDHDRIYEQSKNVEGWRLQTIVLPGKTTKTFYNQLSRRLDFATLLVSAYETTDIAEILGKAPGLIDNYIKEVGTSGEMNRIRWGLQKFRPSWIKDTMTERAAWIKDNYKTLLSVARDDGITVLVNDIPVMFDVKPLIKDGRTLVPVRGIFEALGASVSWDGETSTATAEKGDVVVSIKIGNEEMKVNDEIKILDVPAEIIDGRTLVPVRAVSEAFKCEVSWDGDTQAVIIKG